jgi:hypothetical protein
MRLQNPVTLPRSGKATGLELPVRQAAGSNAIVRIL